MMSGNAIIAVEHLLPDYVFALVFGGGGVYCILLLGIVVFFLRRLFPFFPLCFRVVVSGFCAFLKGGEGGRWLLRG